MIKQNDQTPQVSGPGLPSRKLGGGQPMANRVRRSLQSLREQYREIYSDYRPARETRFTPRQPGTDYYGTGADYHYRIEHDFYAMGELARNLERDDRVVSAGIDRLIDNVIQDGFRYEPQTGNDAADERLRELWAIDTQIDHPIDFSLEHDWHTTERLGLKRVVVEGDLGFSPLSDGRVQVFEFDRIRSPIRRVVPQINLRSSVIHGVERRANGRRIRYWVTVADRSESGVNTRNSRVRSVPAWVEDVNTQQLERNFFHVYFPNRFSQTRGVNFIVPALETAQQHDDVQLAKLVQQQAASHYVLAHKVPVEAGENYTILRAETGTYPEDQYHPIEPGTEYWPKFAGEELEGVSASVPNPEFFDHAQLLLTFIAINLRIPVTLLLLDAGQKNFSGQRFELDQAKMGFRNLQRMFSQRYHSRYLRWRIRRWIATVPAIAADFRALGPELFRHTWGYPAWPYIEPLNEVQADALELSNCFASPREIAKRHNKDYERTAADLCADRAFLINCALDQAVEINQHPWIQEHPEEMVTWREIATHPLPQGFQMQLTDEQQALAVSEGGVPNGGKPEPEPSDGPNN